MNTKLRLTAILLFSVLVGSLWAQADIQTIKTQLDAAKTYDFSRSRDTIDQLEQTIRDITSDQAAARAEVENLLLGSLAEGATPGLRDFICRQLSIVGSARSVPVLLPLLQAPATVEPARYALERIPGAGVDEALRKSLSSVQGKTRLGIITTLGARGDKESVSVLAPFVKDRDSATACTAVTALGRIGTSQAAAALSQVRDQVSGDVQQRVLDALLQCADAIASQRAQEAAAIYGTLFDQKNGTVVQAAALHGLARTEPLKLVNLVLAVLQGQDEGLKPTALALVRELPEAAHVRQVAELMSSLSPANQVLMLDNLAAGHKAAALPYVKAAARSQNLEVQAAALSALGTLGDASCVQLLALSSAMGQAEVQQAARDSLYRLAHEGADQEIIRLIRESKEPEVQVELIRAVEARRTTSAAETLMGIIDSDDRRITQAALKALAVVGRAQDMPILVRKIVTRDRAAMELEDAIVGIAEHRDIQADTTDQVLALSKNNPSIDVQRSMLRLLARLGSDRGVPFVQQSLRNGTDAVRTEAARALSNWPTRSAMALARRIAETDDSPSLRILALRGFIQMAVLPSDEAPQEVFYTLRQAMDLAARDDERWLVLSAMTKAPCKESLAFVQSQLANPSLVAEAQSAVVGICQTLIESEPDLVRDALNQVLAGDPNRALRREVRDLMRRL